jgi:hypothetical protein
MALLDVAHEFIFGLSYRALQSGVFSCLRQRRERQEFNQGVQQAVKNFLETQMGKEVDVTCEGATISGRITQIEGDVLCIEKEGVICYINIQKIVAVWEPRERKVQAPGFGGRPL